MQRKKQNIMGQHMNRLATWALVAGLLAAMPAVKVSSEQAPPVNVPGIDKPVIVVTGEITGTETWVNTNYYVLRGAVFVRQGGTLNIDAGTRVIGEAGSVGTLIVLRGGRLNAIGTAAQPIVFTSDSRSAGETVVTGVVSSSTAAHRSTSKAAKVPGRVTRGSTVAPTRTTTAGFSATSASSSRASSSARTTS